MHIEEETDKTDRLWFCDWCGREFDTDDAEWGPKGTYCSGHCYRMAQNNDKLDRYQGNTDIDEEC